MLTLFAPPEQHGLLIAGASGSTAVPREPRTHLHALRPAQFGGAIARPDVCLTGREAGKLRRRKIAGEGLVHFADVLQPLRTGELVRDKYGAELDHVAWNR